jgi:histidine triad (HIT) family protein
MDDCLFCRISATQIPADLVQADEEFVAFRDLRPQAPIHVLVIPRAHYVNIGDFSSVDPDAVGRYLAFTASVASTLGMQPEGYRLAVNTGAIAGQSVEHVHVHLLGGRPLLWPPG